MSRFLRFCAFLSVLFFTSNAMSAYTCTVSYTSCNAGYHKSGDTCAEDVCYVQYYCNQEDESASESLDFSGTTEAYGVSSAGCSEPTGQHFTGWYEFDPNSEDNSGVTYEEGEEITCPDDGTSYYLAPMYSKNTYTIKYNANGGDGTMADTTATYDVNVTLRSNTFARTGYTFAGWATSATGNVAYSNGQTVKNLASSGTVTLYAKWTAQCHEVSINSYCSALSGKVLYKKTDDSAWYTNNTCTQSTTSVTPFAECPSGYTFRGIYSTNVADLTGDNNTGTQYFTKSGNLTTAGKNLIISAPLTIYAGWAKNCSAGTGCTCSLSVSDTGAVDYTTGASTGYTLSSGSNMYAPSCTANTYTITLDDNNGSGGSGSVKEVYNTKWTNSGGTTITSVTVPSRSGYTFKGYYTATSGGTQHITAAGALPANTTFTSNTTLYAQWTANTYTITLDDNNGSGGSGIVKEVYNTKWTNSGGTTVTSVTVPSRSGYTFKGYYTATSGGTQHITAAGALPANTTFTSHTTLYAQWTQCTACSPTNADCSLSVVNNVCTYTTSCKTGYGSISNNGKYNPSCTANSYSCGAGYYLFGTSCQRCTADYYCPGGEWTYNGGTQGRNSCSTATNNGYPYSEAGSDAITDCYSDTKQRGWTGREVGCTKPANAYSVQCNSCSVDPCDYVAYSNESGTGDGAVKSGCEVNVSPCTQTVASVTCNAGTRRSSTTTCELCGAGTYMDSEGHTNTSCKSASPGHYVDTTGATEQTPCANWTYQPNTGQSSCIACPTVESGYSKANSTGTGWTSYESCVEVATSSPSYCTAGKLQKIPKSSGSTQWATATVNTALQAKSGYYAYGTSCVPCSGGNYCTGGTAQPQKCVAGSYSTGATATCTACPAGTTTSSAGATGASSCTSCSNATNVSSWATPSWKSDNTMTNLCYATGCKYGAYYSASNNGSCTLCSTVSNNTTTTTKISGGTRREVCAGYYISGAGGTKDESMCTGCSYVKSTTVMCDSGFELENGQCINRNMCIVERTYSTCESGYYMTYNGVYDGTPKAGNACTSCPTEYGYSCAGGQARPVKTLTFNLNGGAGTAPATITCNYGESCTLDDGSGTTWYRAGYKFVGWSTNKNATSGSTSASDFVHGNTLYAIWSACANGTYKAAGVAAKNACSACQDLTAPAKPNGTYSTSPESAATAATACRYVGQDIETPANCHNVTKNTVAFNGSSWGSGLYTVTAKKGSRVVTATGVAPTCTQCSGATYQSIDGYTGTSCTPCDSNYQANTNAGKTSASQCQVKCSAGYAVVKENQACETIQNSTYKGKYTAEHYVAYGSTSTIGTCPQYYQDGNGTTAQNQCINSCVAGTMVASANADCTTPNNTTYGSSWYTGSHNVTYGNTSKGLSLVSSCPTANYATPNTTTVSDHNAKADCSITCEAGTVVAMEDANCSTPDGSWYSDRHAVAAGSTSGASKVACDSDYANSGTTAAAHAGEASCKVTCPAGKWVAAEYEACVDLTSGYYTTASQTVSQGSVGTRNECKALNAFYTASDKGRDAATDCYGETTRTNWVKTPKSGQVTCDEDGWCPGGKKVYYNETGGRTACTANSSSAAGSDEITDCSCDAGYSGNAAVVEGTCSACGKGTYKSSAGNTTCTNAGIGYYVDIEGATTRKACTDFRANTSTTGTQSTASSACVCVAGRYLNGSNVCDVCAEGSYKSGLGNNACKAADKNYYVDGTGKTEQIACTDLGSFYTTTESTASTSDMCYGTTTAGKYIKTKNSSTQETCPAKSFCPTTNVYYGGYDTTGGRKPCPAGYQDGTTGYSAESQCLMNVAGGKYVAKEKESVASGTCGLGYAKVAHTVPYGETSSCEPCTGVTYADETGLATCKSCPKPADATLVAYYGNHQTRNGCYAQFGETAVDNGTVAAYWCYIDRDDNVETYGELAGDLAKCWNRRDFLQCDAGHYNSAFNNDANLVEDNSYDTRAELLANSCQAVGAGFWSQEGDITRNDCPGGYVHGSATAASENQCAINVDGGHYIGEIGQNKSNWGTCGLGYAKVAHTVPYGETSSCDPCTGATYADETGLATCKSCPQSTNSETVKMYGYWNTGKDGDHTTVEACQAYFDLETLDTGTARFYCYVDDDSVNEDKTTATYGIDGSGRACFVRSWGLTCNGGYYNSYFAANSSASQLAAGTTLATVRAAACTPVGAGYWSPAGDITRNDCPGGYVHGSATAESRDQCAINVAGGHYIGEIGQNSSNWGTCVNWTYKGAHPVNYGETSSCEPCPAVPSAVDGVAWTKAGGTGWTSYANCVVSQTPANCLSGSVKKTAISASAWGDTVLASTLKSDDGYYANALAIECSAAQPGYFATAGATNQTACVKGSYTDAPAQSACIACGDGANWGLTTTKEGQTSCNATCANKVDDEGENAVSGWKDATWNTNNTVSNSCIPNSCDAHHYMDADNAECPRCDSFANGLYPYSSKNTTNGPEACYLRTNLIPGHYIKEVGDDVATPCPKAMFSEGDEDKVVHYGETSECKSCQGNTYQDEEGATQCKACPDGYTAYWGGDDYDGDGKDADGRIDVRSCRILCPAGSYIANAGDSECTPVGKGYWAAATTSPYIAYGSTSARGQCKDGKTTIGYGAGADEEGDCGRVLHVGDAKLYLRSDKKTELALNVKVGSNMFYGNMSTEEKFMSDGVDKFIRVNVNGTEYTVYDDSGAMYAGSDAGTGITLNPNNIATSVVPASYGEGDGLDWSATVDGVELVGVGACDSNAPSTTTMGTVAADGFEPDGSGSACWCKMTSPGQTSKWILATANAGDLCSTKCGFQCTGGFTGSKAKHISFRTNMYNLSGISTQ